MMNKRFSAMILAAGIGKRMRPLTNNLPKPMIKIGNSTILERQLKIFLSRMDD